MTLSAAEFFKLKAAIATTALVHQLQETENDEDLVRVTHLHLELAEKQLNTLLYQGFKDGILDGLDLSYKDYLKSCS